MSVLQLFLILAIVCVLFCISPLICTVFVFGGMFLYALFRPEEYEGKNERHDEDNFSKVYSILSVLLTRLQKREKQYENMEGLDEVTRTVIVTVFNSLLDVIRTERENYLNDSSTVPDENAEAVALSRLARKMDKAKMIIEKSDFNPTNYANALSVINIVKEEINQLKEEYNLVEVQLPPEEDEIIPPSLDDEDDFPEPDLSFPSMVPDPHTCLAHVAEYEDLAERARNRGLDDLADRYDEAAAHWHNLYEEAEDEEMEW